MTRYLLDTGVASDYINRRSGVFERARSEVATGNRIGIGVPVLAELLYGIELSTSRAINLQRLKVAMTTLTCWPLDEASAAEYGRIAADLRRRGRPMQIMDMLIAAIAMTLNDCVVISKDSDLSAVAGLRVANWTT
ncbi:MAG: type II toxin-antitoxin system VapC family toxin [Planctomycetota bacterium]